MALTSRTRRNRIAAAQELLPEAKIASYSEGVAGPNPLKVLLGLAVLSVAVLALLLPAFDKVVFPGLLILFLVRNGLNPGRALVVDPYGLAMVKRSMVTGRPNQSIGRTPHTYAPQVESSGSMTKVRVGEAAIWLNRVQMAHYEAGRQAVDQSITPPASAPTTSSVSTGSGAPLAGSRGNSDRHSE